jgi:hypothetical protein
MGSTNPSLLGASPSRCALCPFTAVLGTLAERADSLVMSDGVETGSVR